MATYKLGDGYALVIYKKKNSEVCISQLSPGPRRSKRAKQLVEAKLKLVIPKPPMPGKGSIGDKVLTVMRQHPEKKWGFKEIRFAPLLIQEFEASVTQALNMLEMRKIILGNKSKPRIWWLA